MKQEKTYEAIFSGKLKGALGVSYTHRMIVKGKNKEDANINLYNTHDHIHGLKLNEVK